MLLSPFLNFLSYIKPSKNLQAYVTTLQIKLQYLGAEKQWFQTMHDIVYDVYFRAEECQNMEEKVDI
jgi:hypothetical protein